MHSKSREFEFSPGADCRFCPNITLSLSLSLSLSFLWKERVKTRRNHFSLKPDLSLYWFPLGLRGLLRDFILPFICSAWVSICVYFLVFFVRKSGKILSSCFFLPLLLLSSISLSLCVCLVLLFSSRLRFLLRFIFFTFIPSLSLSLFHQSSLEFPGTSRSILSLEEEEPFFFSSWFNESSFIPVSLFLVSVSSFPSLSSSFVHLSQSFYFFIQSFFLLTQSQTHESDWRRGLHKNRIEIPFFVFYYPLLKTSLIGWSAFPLTFCLTSTALKKTMRTMNMG